MLTFWPKYTKCTNKNAKLKAIFKKDIINGGRKGDGHTNGHILNVSRKPVLYSLQKYHTNSLNISHVINYRLYSFTCNQQTFLFAGRLSIRTTLQQHSTTPGIL